MLGDLLDFNLDKPPFEHNPWTCSICWKNRLLGIAMGLVLLGIFFGPALWVLLSGAESK